MQSSRSWARQEFGAAQLGDPRRTARVVEVAARALERPAGTVTGVVRDEAAREAAFRLLRNVHVSVEALARSSHSATLRRCPDGETVFVALDQCSLAITDRTGKKILVRLGQGPTLLCGVYKP